MAGTEAKACVRGSLFVREVAGVLELIESGRLARSELESALTGDELKLVDDADTAPSQWYDVHTVDKLLALMAGESGMPLPEFCRMRGARAAEALWKSGVYQQLEYLDRTQAPDASDSESRSQAFGRDLRLIVSLSKNMFNFTQWTVRRDPENPRRFQIEISQAREFSDLQADCTDGFVNWAAARGQKRRMWEWTRPTPDVVLFYALRDA